MVTEQKWQRATYPASKIIMKASDYTFEAVDEDITFGMGMPNELSDSEGELELSTLDLSSLDYEQLEDKAVPELTSKQKFDKIAEKLSSKPDLVSHLSRGVTSSRLGLLSSAVGYDVEGEYNSNPLFNMFINGLAQGFITSDNFRDTVPNSIKVHYVPESKQDSIHLHNSGTIQMYKSTPAIMAFDEDSIGKLSHLYKGKLDAFSSLYKRLHDACYRPVAVHVATDDSSLLAFDNLTLAQKVSKSRDWNKSIAIIKKAGASASRLNKISILAKSIKDNK
jgi:hypothetical protein